MGQTLSSPATEKKSEFGENDRLLFAVSEMQGWRITMEDAHAAVLNLEETGTKNAFFAVYDGHGGGTVAKFAGQNVHKRLLAEEAYREKRFDEALKKAFLGTDEDLLADPAHTRDPSGCTAVAALVTNERKLYVANAGDSRAVISIKGEAKALSFDHKPSNDTERARIVSAGGYIEFGRVNGNLALSRALGDFQFKKNYSLVPQKQVITADPDVTAHMISDEDEFLVLACDGIWDCLSSQQVVDFIRLKVSEGKELVEIGEMMCEHCLAPDTSSAAGIGCDNMTILIVAILNGRTKQEWYQWMADRVKNQHGFPTPDAIPQIYSTSRLMAYKARREAMEERERVRKERGEDLTGSNLLGGFGPLSSFARALGNTGGISFSPATGIVAEHGRLMFGPQDDEDESGDESEPVGPLNGRSPQNTFPLDPPERHRLTAFEGEDDDDGYYGELDDNAHGDKHPTVNDDDEDEDDDNLPFDDAKGDLTDSQNSESSPGGILQGEAPPPPKPKLNGDVTPVPQLTSEPLGDALNPAIKAEGLMDVCEDPLKA